VFKHTSILFRTTNKPCELHVSANGKKRNDTAMWLILGGKMRVGKKMLK